MEIDLVCGLGVDEEAAEFRVEYRGRVRLFCSEECRATFAADPEKYLTEYFVEDPLCDMEVDVRHPAGKTEYEGHTYYFFARSLKEAFEKDPARYVSAFRARKADRSQKRPFRIPWQKAR